MPSCDLLELEDLQQHGLELRPPLTDLKEGMLREEKDQELSGGQSIR